MERYVIFLGPPASGKGTVAARLAEEHGLEHVSSGQLLRNEIKAYSPVGQAAEPFLARGELVPDPTVLKLMEQHLAGVRERGAGFILDGFPRNVAQAEMLDAWLKRWSERIGKAILFEIDEPSILKRMSGRRTCTRCGQVYHCQFMPPRQAGICDQCGAALVQRPDDTEAVIRHRLEVYRRETAPVAEYYRRQGNLVTIESGRAPLAERYQRTVAALNE